MDIKLFSLCNQDSQEAENGKQKILSCVKDFFPECNGFFDFTSQKRMLVATSCLSPYSPQCITQQKGFFAPLST